MQKQPKRMKDCWSIHDIADVYYERVYTKEHPHTKPKELQKKLIEATTNIGDIVVDPAMGSGSVLKSCIETKRNFLGCDING